MAIFADAFADGADFLAVRPISKASFTVGSEIGRHYLSWQALQDQRTSLAGCGHWSVKPRVIPLPVTTVASGDYCVQIFAARYPIRTVVNSDVSRRRHRRTAR